MRRYGLIPGRSPAKLTIWPTIVSSVTPTKMADLPGDWRVTSAGMGWLFGLTSGSLLSRTNGITRLKVPLEAAVTL